MTLKNIETFLLNLSNHFKVWVMIVESNQTQSPIRKFTRIEKLSQICIHIETVWVSLLCQRAFSYSYAQRIHCREACLKTSASKPLESSEQTTINLEKCFHSRIFPAPIGALSRLDMLRRSLLYCKHHASVHHLNRPILVASISDALRT